MSSEVMPANQQSWTETPPQNPPIRHAIAQVVERQTWLDKLGATLQSWLVKLYGQPGEPNRKIKDMLNGTWLGHALHQVLTDIPLGAWSSTMVLDMAWLTNEDEGAAQGSDISLALGILGAAGSAVTGLTDWSDLDGTDRRVGIFHGLLNGSILLTNIASLILRLTGKPRAGVYLSSAGYAVSLFAAYLGGELVFAKGIGVNHVAWEGGSDDFVAVLAANDLVEGKLTRVDAAGITAVLLNQDTPLSPIAPPCPPLAAPLDEAKSQKGVATPFGHVPSSRGPARWV